MGEGGPPNRLGRQIRVGHLVGHADRQRQVAEVQIVGRIVFVDVDSTNRYRVAGGAPTSGLAEIDLRPACSSARIMRPVGP